MKKRIIILSLAAMLAGLFLSPAPVFADRTVYVLTLYGSCRFCHNPSGYWYLRGNGGSAVIYDRDMGPGRAPCTGSFLSAYMLPGEVVKALRDDPSLKVRLERPSQTSCIDFSYFYYRFTGPGTMEMEMRLSPVVTDFSLGSYVEGLETYIPLIDYRYGRNTYTVYPLIGGASYAPGFFSEDDPSRVSVPYLHPSGISGRDGLFRPGTVINVNGLNQNAALYTIGRSGTLEMEQAVLLDFNCPVKLVFYYPGEDESPDHSYGTGEGYLLPPLSEAELPAAFSLRLHRLF